MSYEICTKLMEINPKICNKFKSYNVQEINNIANITSSDKCKLISNKRAHLYTFTNNTKTVKKQLLDLPMISENNINDFFDISQNNNCCNCFSYTLYFVKNVSIVSILDYLLSLKMSVLHLSTYIPRWVIRLYFDCSVFTMHDINAGEHSQYIYDIMNYIISNSNVEIYLYKCPPCKYIHRLRIARFMPFIDNTVNIVVTKDADSMVLKHHCTQYKIFEESDNLILLDNKMLSLSSFNDNSINDMHSIWGFGYSKWLIYYKKILHNDFFKNHITTYDILAGLLGTKLKLNKKWYFKIVQQCTEFFNDKFDELKFIQIGFDEILLLLLYFPCNGVKAINEHFISVTDSSKILNTVYTNKYKEIYINVTTLIDALVHHNVIHNSEIDSVIASTRILICSIIEFIDISEIKNATLNTKQKICAYIANEFVKASSIIIDICINDHEYIYEQMKGLKNMQIELQLIQCIMLFVDTICDFNALDKNAYINVMLTHSSTMMTSMNMANKTFSYKFKDAFLLMIDMKKNILGKYIGTDQ
jgi:hypothetical protein